MERVIYCPSDEFLAEASSLSRKNSLQIIVGDNDHTRSLEFNREKVSSVSIPRHRYCAFLKTVEKGFHQNIKYINEFVILKNKINLYINNDEVKSLYEESHIAKFVYPCTDVGEHSCKIIVDGKIEEEFSFVIN
jgi:hypothetical protein